jgi:hypothetical protein
LLFTTHNRAVSNVQEENLSCARGRIRRGQVAVAGGRW